MHDELSQAQHLVEAASAIVVAAGAGMSADSGIPVYRGPDGQYQDKPVAGLPWTRLQLATPEPWATDPEVAGQFWRRQIDRFAAAELHAGYDAVARWAAVLPVWAYTSNVDGLFARLLGEDRVYECHGSYLHSQCWSFCGEPISEAAPPALCDCGGRRRPNVLLFSDFGFDGTRRDTQWVALRDWLELHALDRLLIVEVGAGTTIPAVRAFGESMVAGGYAKLLRVNPDPVDLTGAEVTVAGTAAEVLPLLAR